jgi:hypothetical protein
MASITVEPTEFVMVQFDADTIERLVSDLAAEVGVPSATVIRVEIDETVPLGRHRVTGVDPVVLSLEGGALESSRAPRQFDVGSATDVLGRLLFETRDRLDVAFLAPDVGELALAHRAAWDAYNAGRLDRLRHLGQRQRWLYAFRTRHGFTDASDRAFDTLWNGVDLTWETITSVSDGACAAAVA